MTRKILVLGGVWATTMVVAFAAGLLLYHEVRGVYLWGKEMVMGAEPLPPPPAAFNVRTALNSVTVRRVEARYAAGIGGTIAALDDTILLVSRLGQVSRYVEDAAGARFQPISLPPPVKVDLDAVTWDRNRDRIGYKDLVMREREGRVELTLSYVLVDPDRACVYIAISQARLTWPELEAGGGSADWSQLWRSRDCITEPDASAFQAAMPMAWLADGRLGVFVSDMQFDGFFRTLPGVGPQAPESDLGKTLAIDPVTGEATILSFGHRNGGGVAALDGRFWLFEHGVRGGDEINLIEAGNNYGWPYETYGTDYFVGTWPPDATLGTHEGGYEVPRHAFVPSVAPSSMTVYQGALFPEWRGDLVAGTLRGQAVYRIRLNGDQVVYAEPIPVSARVRDITVDGRGRIFLLTDKREEVLVLDDSALEPADSMVAEARQTLAGCNSCHQIDPLDQAGYPAPSLVNVSLREIGSVPGFRYSDALAGLDGVWSKANLRLYLREPDTVAPGTSMPRQDLEETEIRDILTALHTISPDADTLASEARPIGAAQ